MISIFDCFKANQFFGQMKVPAVINYLKACDSVGFYIKIK